MTIPVKILHLEDNEQDASLIKRYLVLTGIKFDLLRVDNKSDFVSALKDFLPELILSNHLTPGINSSEALHICNENNYSGPFILISKVVSDEYGASIVKDEGAYDYVLKSHLQRLPSVINRALANNKLLIENRNCLDENTENVVLLKDTESMAHLGSWQADLKTNIIIWSDEVYRLYGYEPGEIIASLESLLEHIYPDDLKFFQEMTSDKVLAMKDSVKFTFRIIDKQGNLKYLLNQILVKRDKDKKPVRLTGFLLDVTETIEVTKQLEKRERLYKKLIEKSTDMKIIRSSDGIILYVSPSFSHVFGIDMDELIGKDLTEMIHPDDLVKYHQLNKDLLKHPGKSYTIDKRMMHKNGTYLWCEGTVTNWNDDADIEGFVGNFTDVTQKKEDEIEREAITEDLISRNKDLEQFAYIVSHNLRAPVANILGASMLMKDEGIEDDERDLLLNGLDTSIHKLDGVINDLNEILQTKKTMSETRQQVVFSELVSEIKSEIGDMMSRENVEIMTDFSEIDEMLTLKSYMRSIFLNLITNSIKYKRPDTPPVIHISSHRSPSRITLIFRDNGLGINMVKNKDQVFGLYKRFHLKVEGKGMGLYMVKTHVETLGGTIQLKSEVNEGCEFVIDFKR